jgi:hypothetical protein
MKMIKRFMAKVFPKSPFHKPQFGLIHWARLHQHCQQKGHHLLSEVAREAGSKKRWRWCKECHKLEWGTANVATGSDVHASEMLLAGVRHKGIASGIASVNIDA